MARIKYPLFVLTLTAAILLETFTSVFAQTFRPPNRGAPSITAGAGSRSGSCLAPNQKKLTALLPPSKLGLTVSDRPTFFGYIPSTTARTGELLVQEQNNRLVVRKSFAIPDRSGIVSIALPANSPALEVGKTYKWRLRIVCNSDDRSQDVLSDQGWVERIQPSATLANQIQKATPMTLSSVYANAGIWHEALGSIAKLRSTQSNDRTVTKNWQEMLNSVGLEAFTQEPVIDCCQL